MPEKEELKQEKTEPEAINEPAFPPIINNKPKGLNSIAVLMIIGVIIIILLLIVIVVLMGRLDNSTTTDNTLFEENPTQIDEPFETTDEKTDPGEKNNRGSDCTP